MLRFFPRGSGAALAVIATTTLLAMSVWFSATFVARPLTREWGLGEGGATLLTIAVQVGFVLGALASAVLGLPDAVPARRLVGLGAAGAAVCNLGLLAADGLAVAVPLRLLTGVFLALVYPPALREVATWFVRGRGLAMGTVIGALTLGSALPHLVGAATALDWRVVVAATSVAGLAAALLAQLLRRPGPHAPPPRPFRLGAGLRALGERRVALANLGYVGHMWELYAMWAGVGAFLLAVPGVAAGEEPGRTAAVLAFAAIGAGALGCLAGGVISDRRGRAEAALVSLVCSGGAAVVLALTHRTAPLTVVVALCLFWGFWVVADSAQFSAMVTEAAPPDAVGAALSLQMAMGYLTTVVTIALVPWLTREASWTLTLLVLAVGPAVGAAAMVAARRDAVARP
ncbi:MFS transporter [Nocardioides zeae]|uniref:MFS transporter n=1 Tax=Nocardioides imazamoxiresistens TaxID=3231893 RepID=A0ABU3PTW6_9ACTN|nr:MFS transporter [Nocardioides zeae]MDT9592666.1 MFS transporter [Nocardioides zeae]